MIAQLSLRRMGRRPAPGFQTFFYNQILQDLKQRGKLVIVITHDDTYFHLADELIKVDQDQENFSRIANPEHSKIEAVVA